MKNRLPLVVGLVAIALALVVWRCRGSSTSSGSVAITGGSSQIASGSSTPSTASQRRADPKTIGRASIAGTITIEATKAPLAGAQVCANGSSNTLASELLRMPICVKSGATGAFVIENLLPGQYRVSANARTYRPTLFRPAGDPKQAQFWLAAGEAKRGTDIALRPGGAEVTGTVADLTGGPIASARVWSGSRETGVVTTESDVQGVFTIWIDEGYQDVNAAADGYSDNNAGVYAPGKVEILLTPESSLAGIVIDAASGQPVEGARVQLGDWGQEFEFSDAEGKFRFTRLSPGRQEVNARTDHAFGRSEGSTLVGLGQTVDGVVVKLFPAIRIEGKVVIAATKQTCSQPSVSLNDKTASRWIRMRHNPDGTLWAEGVLPGIYEPSVSCEGYQGREKYDRITIADKDVTGLAWEVDAGATIRGKIVLKSGEPIEDAEIWARTIGGAARAKTGWGGDTSRRDGGYELTGLKPGSYKLEVSTDKGIAPRDGYKVEVAANAIVDKDLVLDDGGTLKGTVVDSEGKPVGDVDVAAYLVGGGGRGWGNRKADDSGAFTLEGLRPGEYRVTASRTWGDTLRKPGTTDDAKQGEKAIVRANQVATVRLVVEALNGKIKGTVTDTSGQPVSDAFVSAVRESDAAGAQKSNVQETRWRWDEKPVLTGIDGAFVLEKLAPGKYTIRAYRRGGGEAVAEHVPIDGTAKLQIKPTGSIEGVAKRTGSDPKITEMEVSLHDRKTGFWRDEKFYMTNGRFQIRDLPQGHFNLSVETVGGQKTIELDLGEGEAKTGVTIDIDDLLKITGRLVEHGTNKPVAGMRMFASPLVGGGSFSFGSSSDEPNMTDDNGAFTIENAPRGKLRIRGWPKDWSESEYGSVETIKTPSASGDLGDVVALRKRVKRGDAVGELGVNFAEQPPETLPDQRELKVSWIDPAGPAAKTELKVNDLVTTIDGIDITGASYANASTLMRAAPGTKLVLGLARNASVTIVLAAP